MEESKSDSEQTSQMVTEKKKKIGDLQEREMPAEAKRVADKVIDKIVRILISDNREYIGKRFNPIYLLFLRPT